MYKEPAILPALMKIYTIYCPNTGHVKIMLVLQSCADSVQVPPCSSNDTHAASSDDACDITNIKVEEDIVVIEERFVAINKEAAVGIKQEEIPQDITFPDIKAEPDVSYVHVCLLLYTFYHCQCQFAVLMSIILASCNTTTVGNEKGLL
jgi:hypothetical protein